MTKSTSPAANAGRFGFRESAGEEVDAFDVAIDLFEFMPPLFVVGELGKALGHAHPQHAP
jgi:hypothetical protein